jgi:hypothetical protein
MDEPSSKYTAEELISLILKLKYTAWAIISLSNTKSSEFSGSLTPSARFSKGLAVADRSLSLFRQW